MSEIKFYRVNDLYGCLSNFYPASIILDGKLWFTVEHYFQASKFEDHRLRDKIRLLRSPMDAAKEGRNRSNTLISEWEMVKDDVMYKALKAKFFQNFELKKILLQTGDSMLIEHTVNDSYWADGGDGTGKNKLGELLMKIRDELKAMSEDVNVLFPPWISFHSINRNDLFWRMGIGEDYLTEWYKFVDDYGIDKYKKEFPMPTTWEGILD